MKFRGINQFPVLTLTSEGIVRPHVTIRSVERMCRVAGYSISTSKRMARIVLDGIMQLRLSPTEYFLNELKMPLG